LDAHTHELLRRALAESPAVEQRAKLGDHTRLLPEALTLSLGQLGFVQGGERAFGDHLRRALHDGAWFTSDFPAFVDALRQRHGTLLPMERS